MTGKPLIERSSNPWRSRSSNPILRALRLPRILWQERRWLFYFEVGPNRHNWRRAWMRTDPDAHKAAIDSLIAWSLDPKTWDAVEEADREVCDD